MSKLSFLFAVLLLFYQYSFIEAGCYQRRLCCAGRNNTCRANDDGIDHLPTVSPLSNLSKDFSNLKPGLQTPYYKKTDDGYELVYPAIVEVDGQEKIGKLILPDGHEIEVNSDDNGPAKLIQKARLMSTTTTPAPKITHLIFGKPETIDENPDESLVFQSTGSSGRPRHLLLRYSVIARHLPLTVSTTTNEEAKSKETYSIQYLEAAPIDCYCDEACIGLGDCCSDYTFVCPPKDCLVGDWEAWQPCRADRGKCGTGVQIRERKITQEREGGGAECPPLKETRSCFKHCHRRHLADLTTVALLIDYRFNTTRKNVKSRSHFTRLQAEKLKTAQYYCVTYEIGWVNQNCLNRHIRSRLHRGAYICAECQPEAQVHRNTPRCASDLDDGDEGFWKLIGPRSCNGIWRRVERTDNCRCARDLSYLSPFLLV
ncbi:unnamed protein product [Auanema sp. JU1783]|nr:unnamed protein product [Auanema sp. JU1783]